MRKIAEIHPKNCESIKVYYDEKAVVNPYRVYFNWKKYTPRGLMDRKKQVARYADLASCMRLMYERILAFNEEGR